MNRLNFQRYFKVMIIKNKNVKKKINNRMEIIMKNIIINNYLKYDFKNDYKE